MFAVTESSAAAELKPAGDIEDAPDVALNITACADLARILTGIHIRQFPCRLGRSGFLAFDEAISREHVEISYSDHAYYLRDLGSANGTFLNGKPVPSGKSEPLLFGSRILLGSNTELTFVDTGQKELPDLSGTLIGGRYLLKSCLFPGAKSAVYSATHRDLEGLVAVKILSPRLVRHPGYHEQFEREAKMASGLRHDSIARVLDYGETPLGAGLPSSLYLVMEYFDGGSLRSRLAKGDPLEPARVAGWLERLARGLDYIHSRNVIHGGIKPTAVVFDLTDQPYLNDFATAVATSDQSHRTVIGSPPFLAPEQWEGKQLTPAADQYALAALFYLVITGAHPYENQEYPEKRKLNYLRPPVPAHERASNLRGQMPAAASAVLARAMAIEPGKRYSSVQEFAAAFRETLVEKVTANRRPAVFLSYRRDDSLSWALFIKNELERQYDCDVFVDVLRRDVAGDLPDHLAKSIASSDVFVCLLNRNTLNSEWVKSEIEFAHMAGKPMIPIIQENFRHPRDLNALPVHLQKILQSNGARLYDKQGDYIAAAIQKLNTLIRQSIPNQSAGQS
jgi:serine/threonine-protein kinase